MHVVRSHTALDDRRSDRRSRQKGGVVYDASYPNSITYTTVLDGFCCRRRSTRHTEIGVYKNAASGTTDLHISALQHTDFTGA